MKNIGISQVLKAGLLVVSCTLRCIDISVDINNLNPADLSVTDKDIIGGFRVMTGTLITPSHFLWLKRCVEDENSLTNLAFHIAQLDVTRTNLGFPLFTQMSKSPRAYPDPSLDTGVTIHELNPTGYQICDNDIASGWRVMAGQNVTAQIYTTFRTIILGYNFSLQALSQFYLAHFYPQAHLQIPPLSKIPTFTIELPNHTKLYGYQGDKFVATTIASGFYEPHMVMLINKLVKPGDWTIDVGANIGYITSVLAQRAGKTGKVFAVEALTPLAQLIHKAKQTNGWHQVEVLPYALSNKKDVLVFYNNPVNPAGSIMLEKEEAEDFRRLRPDLVSEVIATPLDSLADKITRLDFMKIDVEGMEDLVLEGAQELIKKFKPLLAFEFTPSLYAKRGVDAVKFLATYQNLGYKFALIQDACYQVNVRAYVKNHALRPADIVAKTISHTDVIGIWYENR